MTSFFSNNNQTFWYVGYINQEPRIDQVFTQVVRNEDSSEIPFQGRYKYTGFKQYIETDLKGWDIYMFECILVE